LHGGASGRYSPRAASRAPRARGGRLTIIRPEPCAAERKFHVNEERIERLLELASSVSALRGYL
jgi:hypothetical protein